MFAIYLAYLYHMSAAESTETMNLHSLGLVESMY